MKELLILDFFQNLPHCPSHFLVFVIDAFDECGNHHSRSAILRLLTSTAARVSWLKVIITSRPKANIQCFFDRLTQPSCLQYDLAKDNEANHDLQTFAQSELDQIAQQWYLPAPWPEKLLFDRLIYQVNGLFIFIKTLILALERCVNPTNFLKATAEEAGAGLKPLYALYSHILNSRIVDCSAKLQQVIGVLLIVAPYRILCEETIAELAGVEPNLIKKWVDDLSSLLY